MEFHKNCLSKDGHRSACKSCENKRQIPKNGYKYCSKCKTEKLLVEFNIQRDRKTGRASWCRLCSRTSTKPIPKTGFKFCNKCHHEKPLSEFTKNRNSVYSHCKSCVNKTDRRKAPRVQEGFKWCNGCKTEKPLTDFYTDKSKRSGYGSQCKECSVKSIVKHEFVKRKVSINFRIKKLLRGRVRNAIKPFKKSDSTLSLIGCSIGQLKIHLQQTAMKNEYLGFDIDFYDSSKYHIDHIVPCSAFHLSCSFHQKLCFNWSNLQILKSDENLKKSDNLYS